MKLVCPGCGAVASAESWINDANCRETLLVISRLPAPLPKVVLGYISLFRPGTQSLTWKKALRLVLEIEALVGKGFVHVQCRIDRDCPPRIWAQAMEQMVELRTSLSLPMPNHIYLSKVAWDLAEQVSRQTETKTEAAKTLAGTRPTEALLLDPLEKARREWDAKHGVQPIPDHLENLATIVKRMD